MGRLSAAGVTDPADIALIRGVIGGLAAEQTAEEPQGRLFADQADRGCSGPPIRGVVAEARPSR